VGVSLELTLARVAQLNAAFAPPMPPHAMPRATAATAPSPNAPAFSALLDRAGGGGNQRIVALARGEVGQTEQPPGSNDSPRIAQYRGAVPGGPVGPWCAYFASWLARQAGTPLGDNGQGFARVDDVWAWAQRSGRAAPAGPGVTPRPGDLIIWDEHMGVVESVRPDGSITTIEGNSSDAVSRRTHPVGGGNAVGFVRMS
jgi:hypothetical protein